MSDCKLRIRWGEEVLAQELPVAGVQTVRARLLYAFQNVWLCGHRVWTECVRYDMASYKSWRACHATLKDGDIRAAPRGCRTNMSE